MTGSVQSENDRRERQRFWINAPLTVILDKREIAGFTRDLSNQGVYFFLDTAGIAPIDGEINFLVELPPEITLSTYCLIRCQGRVVRQEDTSRQLTGIAAEIHKYSILREAAGA
ncbi:MAG: PilZ domain-containing protein [Terracidiphilus sp.]|jgi:hypothetical protein